MRKMERIRTLESQSPTKPDKGTVSGLEIERITSNLKKVEKDKEGYEQRVKDLKKVIETNQNQYTNQIKLINDKHAQGIKELVTYYYLPIFELLE